MSIRKLDGKCRKLATLAISLLSLGGSCNVNANDSIFDWPGADENWVSPATEYDRLTSDRPHVSEATATVGVGKWQLETGFTYTNDSSSGNDFHSYSYPESLLRVGMFQDWFEFRIATNYLKEFQATGNQPSVLTQGFDNLYLGSKIAFFKQNGILPDLTIFPQLRVPTGSKDFTSGYVMPSVNIAYSWALSKFIELECNTVISDIRTSDDRFTEFMQTANVEYDFGPNWIYFTEFFVIQSLGQYPAEQTQSYFHTGVQYFIRPNMQVDLHSAVGLNEPADNLAFTGCGLCVLW